VPNKQKHTCFLAILSIGKFFGNRVCDCGSCFKFVSTNYVIVSNMLKLVNTVVLSSNRGVADWWEMTEWMRRPGGYQKWFN